MKLRYISKILFLSILHIIISPILFFWPKYESYIFVITTGRSGSGTLSKIFKNIELVNSFHEPYPIMNNSLALNQKFLQLWNWYVFYLVKLPTIILSKKKNTTIYLETNHLFLKSFSSHAKFAFKNKLRIIHLIRESHLVAKSMYEINKIPGTFYGNKWYLNPLDKDNNFNFSKIYSKITDEKKDVFKDYYLCLWYWHEMEIRAEKFKENNKSILILQYNTSDLNNSMLLIESLKNELNVCLPQLTKSLKDEDKNLKKDEKIRTIELKRAMSRASAFKAALR
ncbi:hypothetical protein [uncultured Draconibacterium sp.]|uniref:hypothetical protein n=1 Tax=uncultured Draconibacterium sp. TaxID=1573823 RepID=UPI00321786A5